MQAFSELLQTRQEESESAQKYMESHCLNYDFLLLFIQTEKFVSFIQTENT